MQGALKYLKYEATRHWTQYLLSESLSYISSAPLVFWIFINRTYIMKSSSVGGKVITTPFGEFCGDDIKIWRYIHFLRYAVPLWNEERPRVHPEENKTNLFLSALKSCRTCHRLLYSLCIMLFSFPPMHFPSPLYSLYSDIDQAG